jgi:hypothetical protein
MSITGIAKLTTVKKFLTKMLIGTKRVRREWARSPLE